jgi:glucose-1-phosphate adenylyltransferase
VRVDPGAIVEDSILLEDVHIGKDAVIRRTVIDKNVTVPPRSHIGVDPERDHDRFEVSPGGVVAIAKGEIITEPV